MNFTTGQPPANPIHIPLVVAALPEVIQRNCRNCSPQQAQNAQKLTNFLQTRYPEVWAMLIRKYGAV
uniref:Uncharacterized protein n=1 Tax=Anopheles minimus TaxID=112268 RepID=A0A182W788_9DIPT